MERVETASEAKSVIPEDKIVRFDRHQIIQHIVLMVSFILLVLTGLPLKFHDWSISQWWIGMWGGIETTRSIHRFAAWAMFADCVYHLVYIGYTTVVLKRPFPVKIIPTPNDFKLIFQEIGYFLGLTSQRPKFDRFNWREKFDYWAIFWGMPIMCVTGFVMAYPVFVTKYVPGWVVPASFIAHGDEAILAVSWILIVHFFFNHFPPGIFPLNTSIFTGKVSRERYRKEHPLEYERLQRIAEGKGQG